MTFFVLPLVPAIICPALGASLDKDMVSIINSGLALFAGLCFSVSIQIITIDKKRLAVPDAQVVQKQLITNISFLILLSLVTIVCSYISLFTGIESQYVIIPIKWFKFIIDGIVTWLLGVFLMTVLMILKRTSALFKHIAEL